MKTNQTGKATGFRRRSGSRMRELLAEKSGKTLSEYREEVHSYFVRLAPSLQKRLARQDITDKLDAEHAALVAVAEVTAEFREYVKNGREDFAQSCAEKLDYALANYDAVRGQ
jgi:hypothetical protein